MLSSLISHLSDLEDVAVVSLTVTWPFILLGILDRAVAAYCALVKSGLFSTVRRCLTKPRQRTSSLISHTSYLSERR